MLTRKSFLLLSGLLIAVAVACGSEESPTASPEPAQASAPTQSPRPEESPSPPAAAATVTELPKHSNQNSSVGREDDIETIRAVVKWQSDTFGVENWDAFYSTCHPAIVESAKETHAVQKWFEIYPNIAATNFVVEDVVFTGDTSAFVVIGLRWTGGAFNEFGGGPYEKVEGEWYSLGWGCAA